MYFFLSENDVNFELDFIIIYLSFFRLNKYSRRYKTIQTNIKSKNTVIVTFFTKLIMTTHPINLHFFQRYLAVPTKPIYIAHRNYILYTNYILQSYCDK